MARALPRLLFLVLTVATACGGEGDGAAPGARNDDAQQAAGLPAGRDTAQAREAVVRLQAELAQAFVRGDPAPAERILASDFVGVSMDGLSETKAQAVAKIRSDSATVAGTTLQTDTTDVRIYGDAAVVRTSGTLRARSGQQSATRRFRTTDVFVWRDGRWQLAVAHVSSVAEPQGRSRTP